MPNTYGISTGYPEYPLEVTNNFINDPPHESESAPFLTHPPLVPTQCIITQQNNNVPIYQNFQRFFNSIKAFEENVNRQLEQINELKNQLNQMKQSFIAQQQPSIPRRIYRNHVPRPHPYLNERPLVSSRTPTIRSSAPTYQHEYFTIDQLASSNSLHNTPAETTDNNKISPSGTQNYEFW
ncbi:unnamed protein product [Rhizophagus irregularis]|uniref:Uncharacterized protein n=1 Tax=Rhizophagus irregularis TaxID=588596 RepID=A0A2N1NKP4_9GLOM|nr:hypothetical protein RhiirC2_863840 [Rhizophagus irregularis]CAB4382579.1 unnamed protein product [Rhizophagus irregularis]CAB5371722.1 unnamed protein product [Rhizophagus irregularis]